MKNIYSVSQVNRYIKSLISEDYFLSRIYVRGEVSNCKYHSSGHIYFTLKDREGAIPCVMFAGSRNGLKFRLRRNGRNPYRCFLKESASLRRRRERRFRICVIYRPGEILTYSSFCTRPLCRGMRRRTVLSGGLNGWTGNRWISSLSAGAAVRLRIYGPLMRKK